MPRKLPHRRNRNRDRYVRAYRGDHRRPRHPLAAAVLAAVAYVAVFVAVGVGIVLLIWALTGCEPYAPAAPSETPVSSSGGVR